MTNEQTTLTDQNREQLRAYMAECRVKEHPESSLIAILHRAQELYGYLKTEVMDEIALYMNIPSAHIWGVATFYHYFNLSPVGRHSIAVCLGTACYVNGANKVLEAIKKELGVDIGQTTTDGLFTLREARCLGACGLAPVAMFDDKIYGGLDEKKVIEIINTYRKQVS